MAKYQDLKKLLMKNDFEYDRNAKGSHEIWVHRKTGIWTTLTKHSKEISSYVERSIKKAIKLTKESQNEKI